MQVATLHWGSGVTRTTTIPPHELGVGDETAWLETTAELVRIGRFDGIDRHALAEYLADMARRDRREVWSRLVVLLTHVLKWDHQPGRRSNSWRATIMEQGQELAELVGRGVLLAHARSSLEDAYAKAVIRAAGETGLRTGSFPITCPYGLNELLEIDVALLEADPPGESEGQGQIE